LKKLIENAKAEPLIEFTKNLAK